MASWVVTANQVKSGPSAGSACAGSYLKSSTLNAPRGRRRQRQDTALSARRYCTASATWVSCTLSAPARSAIVRATFRQR
ncbi:MAG: hypothetical protein JWR60_322 [Polaromonas sp.]|nr:hypothetical protein [Polaromonas sp.]